MPPLSLSRFRMETSDIFHTVKTSLMKENLNIKARQSKSDTNNVLTCQFFFKKR